MTAAARGAVAGAVGAVAWALADRPLQAVLGTSFSDVRVVAIALGRLGVPVARPFALGGHVALGALAGAALSAVRPRPRRAAAVAALEVELACAWPAMRAVARSGDIAGRRLDVGARGFAEAALGRAVFAFVTGGAARRLA